MRGGRLRLGGAALAAAALAAGLPAAPAGAAPQVDGEFAIPSGVGSNNEIVQGPDGNIWVTLDATTGNGVGNGVARITPQGNVQEFGLPNTSVGIAVGPDDNLWVSTTIGVIKVPPANPAGAQAYDVGIANGAGITAGPDGRIWVAGGDKLVSFSPADPEGTDDPTTITGMNAKGMDVGSDGLLWIADGGGRILSATATATPEVTPYDVGFGPQDVAAGPSAQVAFANPGTSPHEVGLISPGGTPLEIPIETSDPFGVTFGPDGAYWVARASTDDLLRLTTDGQVSTLGGFSDSGNTGPRKVAVGPDNTLWVTLDTQEKVARVTGVGIVPETQLDKAPKRKVRTSKRKAKVKFKFRATEPGAAFECRLSKQGGGGGNNRVAARAAFKPCESPKTYKLKPGRYEFEVRAVIDGEADASPERKKFKVVRKD